MIRVTQVLAGHVILPASHPTVPLSKHSLNFSNQKPYNIINT